MMTVCFPGGARFSHTRGYRAANRLLSLLYSRAKTHKL
jgi:hypothetical protein